ncbi:FEM1 [Fusarium albosuccineum]|uniref:FEM1 n=1 Tax=Fusarium albosuccineum TaxID=1237068 RepID=A0A8H4L499_9HYPO|nr:FEM1 [Fusarium albosuccineum]
MKYTFATVAAFAAVALAEPAFLNTNWDLTQGQPFTIKFSGCESGCTIVLQNGDSDDLKDYKTLTASAEGDSFTFTPSGLPSDDYNFKITDNDSGEINYSSQFPYKGTGVAPTETEETTAPATTEESTTLTSVTKPVSTKEKTTTEEHTTIHTPHANNTTPVSTTKKPTKTAGATKTESDSSETTAAETTGASTVPDSGAARMTSSLALIAGAVMAMVYLN